MSSKVFPSTGEKPKFNPNAAYEAVQDTPAPKGNKPAFNPNKKFEVVTDDQPTQQAQQPKQEQPSFSIQLSTPTFKADQLPPVTSPQGTVIEESHPLPYIKTEGGKLTEGSFSTVNSKTKDFSFVKPYDEMKVHKELGPKAREAHTRVKSEMLGNDKEYENKVREYRRDAYTLENLKEEYKKSGAIMPVESELPKVLKLAQQRQYDLPVTAEDISDIKTGTILNEGGTRKFIKDLKRPDVQQDLYTVDKYNELAHDPNGSFRVDKIKEVAKKIGKGELIYDPEKKVAVKPLGLIGSIVEGTKNKFKADDEYDFLKSAADASIISELENERKGHDPDEPINVPKGKTQEFLMSASEMPLTPIVAGIAGTVGGTFIGNPEIGTYAAAGLGAYENRKAQYRGTFKQVYNELRDQGINENEALQTARKQAEQAQEIGTIVGGAQGLIGAKIAAIPIKGTNFNVGFQQAMGDFLKKNGSEFGRIALDAAAQGGLAASGEVVKNKLAQAAGIKRDIGSGAADAFWGNVFMSGAIGAALKLGRGISKVNYKRILSGVTKNVPEETINAAVQEKVASGEITQEAADTALEEIKKYKEKDSQIPPNVTEEARFKIQDNIDKLNELEQQKEATHKSLQEPINEKIKKLEEDNLALSKELEKPIKVESGLSKSQEKEAIETAEEFVAEGIVPNTYGEMIKKDPIGFWKMIAQQAQNRDENWRPLPEALPEESVREQFGDTVVDYAKELFPAPEVKESSISVIQPGEIKHPETITIKPQERAIPEQIANEVDVRQQTGDGETMGKGNSEPEIPAGTQGPTGSPAEENKTPGQGHVGEPQKIGITHKQMDAIAEEFGLPTYEKSPEKVAEWDEQATKKLQDPNALNNLFGKLRNGEPPDHVETRMMLQYMGDIMAKIEKDPYSRPLQDQLIRTKDLFNIAGRIQGKALEARKGSIPMEETLGDFIIRDREVNKAPLTDEEITIAKSEYDAMKAAKEAYEAKVAKDKEAAVKQKAEKALKEEVKKAKKQPNKDFATEREKIFTDIKEKLRKARGETNITGIPYAKELFAIAPDVAKLMKSYVEQGISELPELISKIHGVLKDQIDGITEKDVHDIIAGEYNKKKTTKSQLASQLYDIRKEAELINELEGLQKGKPPISKNKERQRNQRIEKLREQIKELKDEMGLNERTESERLASLKGRYKTKIKELEEKISKGDYGPDENPEPIKLDKEAIYLKDKMIKLKLDRDARLAKKEYDNRNNIQKAKDLSGEALDVVRTLQTNPDLSFFGRQGIKYLVTHPIQGPKLLWESVLQAKSQKRYDRWLFDIHNSPAWKLIEDSGLAVLDPNTLHAAKREEQWRSQLIHKIPVAGQVAKASERAFTSAANMARVDWFMEGVNILRDQGKTWENSPDEYRGWASAVNNMTGRGGLGKLEPVVGQLAVPFWSPRLIASNANLFLNPKYYMSMPKTARIMLIKNMAQYVVTGAAMLGLAKALGADVELDPRDSDFGKIKVGNTRYDIWGGASQYIRVLSQILSASRGTATGVQELSGKQVLNTGTNFVRTKLSPVWGFMIDAKLGTNVVGEKVEWGDAYKLMIPMLYNDIKDAATDKQGSAEKASVTGMLSFLGIGAQTYGSRSNGSGGESSGNQKPSKPTKQGKPSKTHK